jgi:hypothetical protein
MVRQKPICVVIRVSPRSGAHIIAFIFHLDTSAAGVRVRRLIYESGPESSIPTHIHINPADPALNLGAVSQNDLSARRNIPSDSSLCDHATSTVVKEASGYFLLALGSMWERRDRTLVWGNCLQIHFGG